MVYSYCLGVYKCKNCEFVAAPINPRKKHKFAPPPPSKLICYRHPDEDLEYLSCHCTLQATEQNKSWVMVHSGKHQHPAPPPGLSNIPYDVMIEAQKEIAGNHNGQPLKWVMGDSVRPGLASKHPGLLNKSRLKHIASRLKKPEHLGSTIGAIEQFKREIPDTIVFCGTMHEGGKTVIVLHCPWMTELLQSGCSAVQTDTIHEIVHDLDYDGMIDITMSSMFNPDLNRWSPVLLSFAYATNHIELYRSQRLMD